MQKVEEERDEEWRAEDVNKRMKEYKEMLDTFQPFDGVQLDVKRR